MTIESGLRIVVVGPIVDEVRREHVFVARSSERDVRFSVLPEELDGRRGWCVRIEGVPPPCIVHTTPWPSVEAARDAAVAVIEDILHLERVQRLEMER